MLLRPPRPPAGLAIELFLLRPEDVTEAYVSWLNDPAVNRFLLSRDQVHTVPSVCDFVAGLLESELDLFLGIRYRATGTHVGNIRLGPIEHESASAPLGILVGDRAMWGKGIASTAIDVVADIARASLGLRSLWAGCFVTNVGSRKAFEKAGFAIDRLDTDGGTLLGKPEDVVYLRRSLSF